MYKIIKHGNTHKRIECTKCGCVFEFTGDEVYHEGWGKYTVECPECEHEINAKWAVSGDGNTES